MASWGHVNPIGPRACYDEGKRVAETLTYGFQRQDGVDVRVARIFNTYGPRSKCLPARMIRLVLNTRVWSEPIRWPSCVQLHRPGASRRRHDCVWGWKTNQILPIHP